MKNIHKLIFAINLFFYNSIVYCADRETLGISLEHIDENCNFFINQFRKGKLSIEQIQNLLTCKNCRFSACTNILEIIQNYEYRGNKYLKEIAGSFVKYGIKEIESKILTTLYLSDNLNIAAINFLVYLGSNVNSDEWYRREQSLHNYIAKKLNTLEDQKLRLNIIKILIAAGANYDYDYYCTYGTALNFAANFELNEIVYLLLTIGANPTLMGKDKKTFFDYAKDKPRVLEVYAKFKKEKRKSLNEAIGQPNSVNQDIPDVLIEIINEY